MTLKLARTRRWVRRLGLALFLLGTIGLGIFYGYVVNEKRYPPYRTISRAYDALKPAHAWFQHKFRRSDGRFRSSREPALTRQQQEDLEQLRALGYVAGSTVAGHGPEGVVVHDAEGAWQGLNLALDGHAPRAALLDMNGNELHSWRRSFEDAFPGADVPGHPEGIAFWRRARLLADGDLLAIFEGSGLIRIDSESSLVWAYDGWAHHDLDLDADGNIYVLTRRAELLPRISRDRMVLHDFVTVLSPGGEPLREISILEAIERSEYRHSMLARMDPYGDLLHTNTLEILDGRLADRIPSFRAGNVLISIRQLDTIAVLDLETSEIKWALAGLFYRQHQPTVLPNGNLLVFDNLADSSWSRVLEFDPGSQEVVWAYRGDQRGLFSRFLGSCQRLPNGNTLITESENGRALEVTPDLRTVWEYRTPHRAGKEGELIASLFEVERLRADAADWLSHEAKDAGPAKPGVQQN